MQTDRKFEAKEELSMSEVKWQPCWVKDSLHEDSVNNIRWNGRELLGCASVEFIDVVCPGAVNEHVQQLQKHTTDKHWQTMSIGLLQATTGQQFFFEKFFLNIVRVQDRT